MSARSLAAARPLEALVAVTADGGESVFDGAGGVRLHTMRWRPTGPTRAAVAIVPGLKDHSARYGAFAERLAARGFAVHSFDLRGHGRSEGESGWVEAFDDHVADLDAFVDHVTSAEDGAPLFVLGHSVGGAIATLWALDRGARVRGLLLSAPLLRARLSSAAVWATRAVAAIAPKARILAFDVRRFSRDRRTVADSVRDGLVHHRPWPARSAWEMLAAIARIESRATQLDVPLLGMHGSDDPVGDPDGTVRLVDRAASHDKELRLYDGLSHDLLHEPERDRVMWDAIDWMERRTG
jgi:alpha-beta hydrolase superfamily lysophospholipase